MIKGDKIRLIAKMGMFDNIGEICEVVNVDENGVISFRFGKNGMHLGCMSYNEFEKYFELVQETKREWSPWKTKELHYDDLHGYHISDIMLYRHNGKKVQVKCFYDEILIKAEAMLFSMIGFDQKNPHHNMYLDQHCDFVYNMFSGRQHPYSIYNNGFLMGASLHDIGKLYTQSIDENGIAHYLRHENVGSYFVLTSLYQWKNFTDDDLLDCCFLINYHMMPFSWENENTRNRWRERFGEYKYDLLMKFHECDITR